MKSSSWIPEIMYEEAEEGTSSNIPFVMVPRGQIMPQMLFIFESRETDTTEPNQDGDEVPVYEWDLHQYADMLILKNKLDPTTYDKVRLALDLEPLADATAKGEKITKKVRNNLNT